MQYLMLLYLDEAKADGRTPEEMERGTAAYMAYAEALKKAGALVGAERLQRSRAATTLRLVDGAPQVLDGPFAESKEQLAGFFMIEAPDLDAALGWAARCPAASHGTVEVRPVWQM